MIKNLFFFNEINQVNIRNKILQKKYYFFKFYYHHLLIVTSFFKINLLLFCFFVFIL